jgi:hypothetical protein
MPYLGGGGGCRSEMRNDRTWEHNPTGVICNKQVLHVIFTNRYFQDEIFLGFKEGGEGEGSPKSALGAVSARPILHGLGMGAGRIPISCGRTRPGLSMGSCGPVLSTHVYMDYIDIVKQPGRLI